MSYPGNIDDCSKPPSKGGIPMNELKDLAERMGIDTTGLKKTEICDKIKALVGKKTRTRYSDDDDNDVAILETRRPKPGPKPQQEQRPQKPQSEPHKEIAKKKIQIKMRPPQPPTIPEWFIAGQRPQLDNVMRYAVSLQTSDWIYYVLGTATLVDKPTAYALLDEYVDKGVIPEDLSINVRKNIINL